MEKCLILLPLTTEISIQIEPPLSNLDLTEAGLLRSEMCDQMRAGFFRLRFCSLDLTVTTEPGMRPFVTGLLQISLQIVTDNDESELGPESCINLQRRH